MSSQVCALYQPPRLRVARQRRARHHAVHTSSLIPGPNRQAPHPQHPSVHTHLRTPTPLCCMAPGLKATHNTHTRTRTRTRTYTHKRLTRMLLQPGAPVVLSLSLSLSSHSFHARTASSRGQPCSSRRCVRPGPPPLSVSGPAAPADPSLSGDLLLLFWLAAPATASSPIEETAWGS